MDQSIKVLNQIRIALWIRFVFSDFLLLKDAKRFLLKGNL